MIKKSILILCTVCLLLGSLPATAYAAGDNNYTINGVTVRWDDFTSRPNNCQAYALKMYEKIWGVDFTANFYAEDNFLRGLENEELTLTEEHLKEYVTNAALGSTIRVSSAKFLHRNDGNLGHSQIIVQVDEEGFTVLEGGLRDYPYCAENYYTWSDFVNAHWLGGKYGYIKYIKWPGAPEYTENYGAEAPEVSIPVITKNESNDGFSITYTATDDLGVEEAYIRVWAQGQSEEQGKTYQCDWDGETASASVTCSFSGDVRNFYCKWYAVDANGNVGGGDQEARMISFYTAQVNCVGICKAIVADAPVCTAPYTTVNGQDTVKYKVSEGARLSISGIYRNDEGARWYHLSNGLWVSEEYVRYDTFSSFVDWIYGSYSQKGYIYLDGQVLFTGE